MAAPPAAGGDIPPPVSQPKETRVLLTLHNLLNIPPEFKSLNGGGGKESDGQIKTLTVEVTAIATNKSNPPFALQTAEAIVPTSLIETGDEGRLELKLTEAVDWVIPYEPTLIGINVAVWEGGASRGENKKRKIGEAAPAKPGIKFALQLHLDEIMKKKLVTRIVGTRMGQLGMSIGVSPRDSEGYRYRLDQFLRQYNPKSLERMESVLKAVSELSTFTKLFRKYKVVDYEERAGLFYAMYGPEHLSTVAASLADWENKEELFMQSLCLDNGPEPADIDLRKRIVAFAEHHNIPLDVEALVRTHIETPHVLFKQLVSQHGQEPDPRTYLFPPTVYETASVAAARSDQPPPPGTAPLVGSGPGAVSRLQDQPLGGHQSSSDALGRVKSPAEASISNRPATGSEPASVQPHGGRLQETSAATQQQSAVPASHVPPQYTTVGSNNDNNNEASINSNNNQQKPRTPIVESLQQQAAAVQSGQQPVAADHQPQQQQQSSQPGEISTKSQLAGTAQPTAVAGTRTPPAGGSGGPGGGVGSKRVNQQNSMTKGSIAGGASTGAGTFANIIELWSTFCSDLRTVGVPTSELFYLDEDSFLGLLAELRYDQSARLQLVHEWERRVSTSLRVDYATPSDSTTEAAKRDVVSLSGMSALSVNLAGVAALSNGEHEAAFTLRLSNAKLRATERLIYIGDHNFLMEIALRGFSPSPGTAKFMAFPKKPFAHIDRPTTVSALVCDVIVGKPLVTVMDAPPANQEFFDQFDSAIRFVNTERQETLVYSPQQVLPRFIVHVTIDPTIVPCKRNPTKPVEYFVVENGDFACSQCVVMGCYKGKHVITIEEAATQAKTELMDLAKHAGTFSAEVSDHEQTIQRQLQQLTVADARQNAIREAEQIRKEAERKAADLIAAAESEVKQIESRLTEEQKEVTHVRDEVNHVVQKLERAQQASSAMRSLELLTQLREGNELERIRARYDQSRGGISVGGGGHPAGAGASSSMIRPPTPRSQSLNLGGHNSSSSAATFPGGAGSGQPRSRGELYAKFVNAKQGQDETPPHPLVSQSGMTHGNNSSLFGGPSQMTSAFADRSLAKMGPMGSSSGIPGTMNQSMSVPRGGSVSVSAPGHQNQQQVGVGLSSSGGHPQDPEVKEQMKRGWAAYRNGDREMAQTLWMSIYERHQDNAVGARARAYVAEAIEKDYNNAAVWYEKALRIDPNDYMTLFNYGVLLESVLGKRREALTFFEAAARLGDQTAARRAEVLQQQLGVRPNY